MLPLTRTVVFGAPAMTAAGFKVMAPGAGLLMAKFAVPERPPPGAGLKTLSAAEPALAMSATVIGTVNCEAETKVVTRSAPLNLTTEPLIKLLPLSASVNAAPPAIALSGVSIAIAGTGFGGVIVKTAASEEMPPAAGSKTVTFAEP